MITLYHNPRCSTSRKTLDLLTEAGIEPQVVRYLDTPPDRATLARLAAGLGGSARQLLRSKEPLCRELGLDAGTEDDGRILDAIASHPILLNRPVAVSEKGVRVCRPPETVRDLI